MRQTHQADGGLHAMRISSERGTSWGSTPYDSGRTALAASAAGRRGGWRKQERDIDGAPRVGMASVGQTYRRRAPSLLWGIRDVVRVHRCRHVLSVSIRNGVHHCGRRCELSILKSRSTMNCDDQTFDNLKAQTLQPLHLALLRAAVVNTV